VQVNLGIWEKLTKLVVFLLFVSGIVAVCIWYLPLIRQNERMRQQLYQLDIKVKQEEDRSKTLKASVEAVKTDPSTIERLARANLGYARTGEVVVRFEEPKRY
jgi:cell division protein FtsB